MMLLYCAMLVKYVTVMVEVAMKWVLLDCVVGNCAESFSQPTVAPSSLIHSVAWAKGKFDFFVCNVKLSNGQWQYLRLV